jgi:long-chain fatty acid transport protein
MRVGLSRRDLMKTRPGVPDCSCKVMVPPLLLLIALLAASPAVAGGLYIQEFATPSQGTAGAGAGAVARDASTAFHNPSGMTRLDDHATMQGGGLVFGDIRFDADGDTPFPGNNGGNQSGLGLLVGGHHVHWLSDRWRIGGSLVSVSASALDPDNDWAGRFQLEEVSFLTLTGNPSIAYRVNDWLSLAVSGYVTYGRLEQDVAIPGGGRVELGGLDDVAASWGMSALFEPSERTRISLTFVDEIELDLSGDIHITPPGASAGIDTTVPLVRNVRLGVYHEINDQWAVLGSASWEDWSAFMEQTVSVRRGSAVIDRGRKDTWGVGAGLEYRPDEVWLWQAGVRYDSSPVDSDHRTADVPIDRQWRFSGGLERARSATTTVAGAFTYANYGSARIRNETLRGSYRRNDLFFLTFHVGFSKLPWSRHDGA